MRKILSIVVALAVTITTMAAASFSVSATSMWRPANHKDTSKYSYEWVHLEIYDGRYENGKLVPDTLLYTLHLEGPNNNYTWLIYGSYKCEFKVDKNHNIFYHIGNIVSDSRTRDNQGNTYNPISIDFKDGSIVDSILYEEVTGDNVYWDKYDNASINLIISKIKDANGELIDAPQIEPGDVDITIEGIPEEAQHQEEPEVKPEEKPETKFDEEVEDGEKVSLRIDTAKNMAVRFEDGKVFYNGDIKEVIVGKEYPFQIASVNWENGIYDENGNGLCGTVVYKMKVVHENEFVELRKEAITNPDRYTVKGIDIIDNETKTIVINCDAGDFHLETDVNNFFMAYRFHFTNGDYNKQTGIKNVINNPVESLSVNLPLGATVTADAYVKNQLVGSNEVLICNNDGQGIYESIYLTSVNDYYWNY